MELKIHQLKKIEVSLTEKLAKLQDSYFDIGQFDAWKQLIYEVRMEIQKQMESIKDE